jgi:hypothetical protein
MSPARANNSFLTAAMEYEDELSTPSGNGEIFSDTELVSNGLHKLFKGYMKWKIGSLVPRLVVGLLGKPRWEMVCKAII